jgi:predicted ATP-grasp superfamily ATP-dependent carboligase
MSSAIVLDGQLKSALAIVRSLGAQKIAVCVGAERETGMALHSKYATATFVYPSPYTSISAFITAVEKEALRLGDNPVIFAASDATFLALYGARERLSACATLLFPDERAMEIAFDKAITQSLARVSNIPIIPTLMPATPDELQRVASALTYPAVIKPRKSVTLHRGVRHFGSAEFIHNKESLMRRFNELKDALGESPLIQERVSGEEYGVEAIAHKGVPFTLVTHHRLRSLSPTGGASVLKETVEKGAVRDMLETYTRKIIQELHWEGPIMIEFKVDSDTKTPKLMEVNGRFWGSLPLSVRAGVDMPYHYYVLATTGKFPEDAPTPRENTITRHFWGDVRHLLHVLFGRSPMRSYTYPKRMDAIRTFFKTPQGTKGDVWLLADPKPALMEVVDILKRIWK